MKLEKNGIGFLRRFQEFNKLKKEFFYEENEFK